MMLTARSVAYLGSEEGIVPEAYRDGVGVWTWAMGLATTGGFDVLKYKDKPQSLDVCLRASIDMIRAKYLPEVVRAFAGKDLTEAQLAAALSFEWNTGAIRTATWVHDFLRGDLAAAEADILNWSSHGLLTKRRKREQALFFHGTWPPLTVPIWGVAKPSYHCVGAKLVDLEPLLQQILGGN